MESKHKAAWSGHVPGTAASSLRYMRDGSETGRRSPPPPPLGCTYLDLDADRDRERVGLTTAEETWRVPGWVPDSSGSGSAATLPLALISSVVAISQTVNSAALVAHNTDQRIGMW